MVYYNNNIFCLIKIKWYLIWIKSDNTHLSSRIRPIVVVAIIVLRGCHCWQRELAVAGDVDNIVDHRSNKEEGEILF